jgi:glycosyltransferase involved in cell wall biosynthesis
VNTTPTKRGGPDETMRILQILHDHELSGVQALAAMIEDGLRPHGIVFETAYLFPRPGLPALAKLAHVAAMARRILRGGFDAVIAYQATASILAGAVGRMQGCRLRIVHQTCLPGETATLVRAADRLVGTLGLYTVNVANSAATFTEFDDYPARYRRTLTLIEHGLDAPLPSRGRIETRGRFGLPRSKPLLLNVGRLVAQKNQDVLIRALAKVPEARLAMAGGGMNEECYRSLAVNLGVADRLHVLGALDPSDIADLYAAADLFVFPSTWETFGLAAVEAAMAGLPIVAADLAVLREVLTTPEPHHAAFVPPHDVDAWAGAIQAMLKGPPAPEALRRFADAVARKYSRDRMIERYLGLLKPRQVEPAPSWSRRQIAS